MSENPFFELRSAVRKPLYRQAAEKILQEFVAGRPPGTRIPTEEELAASIKVSSTTIRAALRELVKEHYLERRQGSGTYVADRELPERHVAVLLELDISNRRLSPFYLKLLQEVRLAFVRLGIPARPYLGFVQPGQRGGELTCHDLLEDLRWNRIQGVVSLFSARPGSLRLRLGGRPVPVVGCQPSSEYAVGVDFEKMIQLVLNHFSERGRRRIAVIGWDTNQIIPRALDKFAPRFGIALDHSLVELGANGWQKGMGWQAFREVWTRRPEKPDCLFVSDDMIFDDCQQALLEIGIKTPDQLDITVFGSDAVPLKPILTFTHCRFSTLEVAHTLADTMQRCLQGDSIPDFTELQVNFAVVTPEPVEGMEPSETAPCS